MLLPIPEDVLQAQARERMTDMLLGSLGLSAAAVSASFAVYMITVSPSGGAATSPSRIVMALGTGVEHQAVRAVAAPPDMTAEPAGAAADQALDFTPIGTIPAATGPRPGKAASQAKAVLPDFAVRDVFDDTALVEAHGTLQMVQPGSVIAGAGEVLSIARTEEGWVVKTAEGTITQRR